MLCGRSIENNDGEGNSEAAVKKRPVERTWEEREVRNRCKKSEKKQRIEKKQFRKVRRISKCYKPPVPVAMGGVME